MYSPRQGGSSGRMGAQIPESKHERSEAWGGQPCILSFLLGGWPGTPTRTATRLMWMSGRPVMGYLATGAAGPPTVGQNADTPRSAHIRVGPHPPITTTTGAAALTTTTPSARTAGVPDPTSGLPAACIANRMGQDHQPACLARLAPSGI
jgi:hypothetical protein